jgi:hypothetical protein
MPLGHLLDQWEAHKRSTDWHGPSASILLRISSLTAFERITNMIYFNCHLDKTYRNLNCDYLYFRRLKR